MSLAELDPAEMVTHLRGLGYHVTPPTGGRDHIAKRNEILRRVCKHTGVEHIDLIGETRFGEVYRARRLAIYLLRTELHMSFPAIGRTFWRDHTTIRTAWLQAHSGPNAAAIQAEAALAKAVKL